MSNPPNLNPPNPTVICLGEILIDRIADHVTPTIAAVQSWTDYAGGAPANVACALSRLGTRASFVGAVGDDDRGQELVALLQAKGVDPTGVQTIAAHPTRTVLVLRTSTGDRTFAGFGENLATTAFADTQIQSENLPSEIFRSAQFLVVGTLGLATDSSRMALERAIDLAHTHNCEIVLDINWRPVFWPQLDIAKPLIRQLIPLVDWLKLSIEESHWLFATRDPQTIVHQFPQLKGVCITRAAAGCDYWLNGHSGHQPGFAVPVQDTTGAGDSFVAGLIHQLGQVGSTDLTAQQAATIVTYACAVGALTTTQNGAIAAQPHPDQIRQLLQQEGV
jgi:fructokinase